MSKEQGDEIRKNVLERMDVSRDLADEELCDLIQEEMKESRRGRVISLMQREKLTERVFNSLRKLDVLQELLEDEEITEIMVNGPEKIFYEKRGGLYQWDKQFSSVDKLEDIIQQIAGNSNRMVNESSPIVDTRLSDGSRVNIVLHPIALDGSMICIRKFPKEPLGMRQLLAYHSISEEAADFLKKLVRAGYNIFVSGGTGSGKTTFLNALSEFIPEEERIITIEDSAELKITGIPNLVRLETRNANAQGTNAVSMRDLIKTALRMRPEGIKIKKGKLKRKKKRIPIPHTFLQHILGNLIPLIRCEVVKIIEEADDLLSFFHSILHVESILPINGICTQHSFPE